MQDNNGTESNLDSISSDEFGLQGDSDADAFAVLGILLIIACTVVYYLNG